MAAPRIPLSVVIPVLDEGDQITECVRLLAWADEVIVADGGSRDDTVGLARAAGATVLERTGPTIAAQRNAAIARAGNRWVFALDADERIPDALRGELTEVVTAPRHQAYQVRRMNFYLGRELTRGRWGRDWVTRLFTCDRRYVERRVHEGLEPVSDVGRLDAPLLHRPYRDLRHQIEKMNRYARWGAEDLFDQGSRATLWDLSGRPLGRFLRAYLLQGGCLEGRFGLVTSLLGGYTAFLKYAHLWELERRGPGSAG
jgi:glycosyltransferase involved in cell wall biosynthesis